MKSDSNIFSRFAGSALALAIGATQGLAQSTRLKEAEVISRSGDQWVYTIIFIILSGVGLAYYLWRKSRRSIVKTRGKDSFEDRETSYFSSVDYDSDVDAEKELEWLRKSKKGKKAPPTMAYRPLEPEANLTKPSVQPSNGGDTRIFQEKMKMLQYSQLPINSFSEISAARSYEPLQESSAKNLLDAIDQANVEFEQDEFVRDVAIKVLAAFRTANSVDALSQTALYDLSASLRSKAVTVLADFDHESVFETILLACADPSREVRAAAARGLFRLNFDRSHAWKRLIETDDEFRMGQAVRAAVEAGIAIKSFERLIHEDLKVANEAFVLVALMIKSGETDEIFTALRDHRDERVKLALLHVLKAIKDERCSIELDGLIQSTNLSSNVIARVQDTLDTLKGVRAKISA